MICYLFDNILVFTFNAIKNVRVGSRSGRIHSYWTLGSGYVIPDNGSADPEEIFTDPHYLLIRSRDGIMLN
jgi:hypothetical protein